VISVLVRVCVRGEDIELREMREGELRRIDEEDWFGD
jgi:hypothetical protein